jgi:3-deoxy-manno-octulosonate cytidylyltransferase (CMP-KDO synthetase)
VHPYETVSPEPAPAGSGPAEGLAASARIVAAIPARYASTRLPGKPLAPIAGRPMIEHVYRRVAAAQGIGRVVVLTDDERIGQAVEAFGGEWEMTPSACASGTDRVAFAARRWEAAAVINVQGDEPLIDPAAISAIAAHLANHPEDPMVTLAAPIPPDRTPEELADPGVVKVVLDRDGYALYFSRAAIPYRRQPGGAEPLKHLGIYGYRWPALLALAALPPSPLEISESLEQLRALENGVRIRVLPADRGSPSVDTPEDLARVERLIASERR